MARFVLETKATLMNEQETKFKDGEASITALQVYVLPSFVWKLVFFHHFYTHFISNFLKVKQKKLNLLIETNITILAKFLKQ